MARSRARSAVKAGTRDTQSDIVSWLFMSCTFLMFAGVIPMWSHWDEIAASLGIYSSACVLMAVTVAALIVALWVNTGND